jgi:ParB-like chromosome segregation protein Spo0J
LSKAPVRTFLEEGPMSARLMRVGAPIQFHPFADIFPLLEGEAFAAFVENIKANDMLESIVVFKGKILDGRNRYRACLEAGIEPDFVDNSDDDPLNDVLSWNLHRRHLNESQRAWIEAKIANMPRGTNQHAQICAPLQDDAAAMLNVSRRTVQHAATIRDLGIPELQHAVDQGHLSASIAATAAKQPPERQREAVAAETASKDHVLAH